MATEKRLIEARYLTSQMYLICEACQTENIFIDVIIDEIDNAPTVDAVEVVHAHWIPDDYYDICSHCNHPVVLHDRRKPDRYCRNCGAKMDGGSYG